MVLGEDILEESPFLALNLISSWCPERKGKRRIHMALTPPACGTITSVPTRHICIPIGTNGILAHQQNCFSFSPKLGILQKNLLLTGFHHDVLQNP